MITIEGPEEEQAKDLAKVASGSIAKPVEAVGPLTVGLLEHALLARFPRSDAESWDRMGIVVGDPSAPVAGVCVALDPTRQAIRAAASLGANVLLTHHPVFIEPPEAFSPSFDCASVAGANVWEAAHSDVALINVHTALDVSDEARHLYMNMLGSAYKRMLVASESNPNRGYGYLCAVRDADSPFKLAHLAARCTSVFGRAPRVWGDMQRKLQSVAFANGSAGNVVEACLEAQVDCLVCGEIRYHAALDAAQAGLAIVELGHDASELPLTALLAKAAVEAGVAPESVQVLDQSGNWELPDSTRL